MIALPFYGGAKGIVASQNGGFTDSRYSLGDELRFEQAFRLRSRRQSKEVQGRHMGRIRKIQDLRAVSQNFRSSSFRYNSWHEHW